MSSVKPYVFSTVRKLGTILVGDLYMKGDHDIESYYMKIYPRDTRCIVVKTSCVGSESW